MEFIVNVFATILGGILGVIIIIAFFVYMMAYVIHFIKIGLKFLAIILILGVISIPFGLLEKLFSKDERKEVAYEQDMDWSFFDNRDEQTYTAASSVLYEDVDTFIGDFLTAYEEGDDKQTSYYLEDGTAIAASHLSYMASQQQRGISLRLQLYDVLEMTSISSTTLEVKTYEVFDVAESSGAMRTVEQQVVYTLALVNGYLQIRDMVVSM